ncbi:MAG: hypothetical protein HQM16_18035 [Deltaproteobacteria bacterium]|nr:hypothetical protein [Deltaproteobacteria bacterium]
MTTHTYIATPYGAPLYQTLKLARGQIFPKGRDKLFDNCGIIFRRICDSNGKPIDVVKDLKPNDNLLLMYNFAHTGVIYPIQQFKILDPNVAKGRIHFPVQKEPGFDAIGKISLESFIRINFVPDYLDSEDIDGATDQNVICVESHTEWLPKDLVGKVYLNTSQHEPTIKDLDKLEFVDEKNAAKILEAHYNEFIKDKKLENVLFDEHKAFWKQYNGWIKTMLYENKRLEAAKSKTGDDTAGQANSRLVNYAFEAMPFCAIFEYVLNMLLKNEANSLILDTGKPLKGDTELSVFPESTMEGLDCWDRINMILYQVDQKMIMTAPLNYMEFKNLLHNLRKLRNRIAHSYFIEKHHHDRMRLCVQDLLRVFCLNGGF